MILKIKHNDIKKSKTFADVVVGDLFYCNDCKDSVYYGKLMIKLMNFEPHGTTCNGFSLETREKVFFGDRDLVSLINSAEISISRD